MINPHGEHIWYELITSDPDAAQRFYEDVVGWSIAASGMPGTDYRIVSAPDGEGVAGVTKLPEGMANGPVWMGYVGVDDVDAAVARIEGAGGAVHMPATTIEGVGRMAMVADPQGATFYVMRGAMDAESRAFRSSDPQGDDATIGHGVWNELSARDPDTALAFYGDQFGWTQAGSMPMGEMGEYRFLQGPRTVLGALMGGGGGWRYHFHVADIDAALDRARAGGGIVVQEAGEIPGGSFSAVIADPQGARVGLVGERMEA